MTLAREDVIHDTTDSGCMIDESVRRRGVEDGICTGRAESSFVDGSQCHVVCLRVIHACDPECRAIRIQP